MMSKSRRQSISKTVVTFAVSVLVGSMTFGCDKPSDQGASRPASAPDAAATAEKPASPEVAAVVTDAAPTMAHGDKGTNWFGGPVYSGEPALAATAALIKAGGGADKFSFKTALVSMLGEKTVKEEVEKLTKQYGADDVKGFIDGMDFAVKDAIKLLTAKGVKLPPAPDDLTGTKLAKALVEAGTAPDETFWSGHLFDKALSHDIHMMVMVDIDKAVGHKADETTHKILNQAMYDVAQALKMKNVKLASLH